MSEDIKDLNSDIMSDDSAPWHLRIYYYKKHFDMVEKIFQATAKGEEKLNAEIKAFINDVNIQPYIIDSTSCDEEDDGAMPVPESPETLREVKRTSIEKYADDSMSNSSELFDLGEPTFVHPEEGFRILGKRKKRQESKFAYDSNDELYWNNLIIYIYISITFFLYLHMCPCQMLCYPIFQGLFYTCISQTYLL